MLRRYLQTTLSLTWLLVSLSASAAPPDEPFFISGGTWGQPGKDQWAIQRVGLNDSSQSAWALLGDSPSPVTVAVIDTGLDWFHLDLDQKNLWRNPGEIPDNGVDDDGNGYVDDIIGWDFYTNTNKPWDHDGHGTMVAGIIAASGTNSVGIAGINPHARIMALKAVNNFGHTRAAYIAGAIKYATDNGARVINLSLGGPGLTSVEFAAVDYAVSNNVMVVIAAGNEAQSLESYGAASHGRVITVGASDFDDKRAPFSNWGPQLSLVAPGLDVLGLRARRTDTLRDFDGNDYEPGSAYVGQDRRYYRASGTSFSAPIVTGVASLVLSKYPDLSVAELKRILLHSARDLEAPGYDQATGYGIVDAAAALQADREFFVDARIAGVQVVQEGKRAVLQITGTAAATRLASAHLELGEGSEPSKWKKVGKRLRSPVEQGILGEVPSTEFAGASSWTIRLVAKHANGQQREARFFLNLK